MKNGTVAYRVGQLEKQVDKISCKLDTMMTNDVPHLREDILSLKTKVNVLTAINIGAIIIGLIVSKLF